MCFIIFLTYISSVTSGEIMFSCICRPFVSSSVTCLIISLDYFLLDSWSFKFLFIRVLYKFMYWTFSIISITHMTSSIIVLFFHLFMIYFNIKYTTFLYSSQIYFVRQSNILIFSSGLMLLVLCLKSPYTSWVHKIIYYISVYTSFFLNAFRIYLYIWYEVGI